MNTIKFYSTLTVRCEPDSTLGENYGGDFVGMHEYVEIPTSVAAYYKDEILAALSNEKLPKDRGLMEYFHNDQAVGRKVYSLHPTVEEYDGKLWGVMEAKLRGRLTEAETKILTEYITGQYSDGFGEGFEQRPIKTAHGGIYVSFWDRYLFSILPEYVLKNLPAPISERPKEFSVTLVGDESNGDSGEGFLDLPAETPEILDAMDKARVRGGQEYSVEVRYVYRKCLQKLIPDNPSLYELNYLAERLSQLDEHELLCFEGVVKMEKEGPDLARLINLTYNLDDCQVVNARNDYQLGKFYAENDFVDWLDDVSDEVFAMIDFEKVGKSMREGENGVFLGNGYVVQPVAEKNLKLPYSGNHPQTYEEPPYIFRLHITNESNVSKGTWLELPAAEDALKQAARKLEIPSVDGCMFTKCTGEIPQLNMSLSGYEGITELNQFAHKLSEIKANGDLPKYKAVLYSTGCEELSDCVRLADSLPSFAFHPDTVTQADYGEKVFEVLHGLRRCDEGMEHFNFYAFGGKQLEQSGAALTPYGAILPLGNAQEQQYRQEKEHEQDAGLNQEMDNGCPILSM